MIDGGLGRLFREHLPEVHWQRIETGGTGRGIPDTNYCYNGKEGWIEYKRADANAVELRPEQVGWIMRRKRAGGRVFVAVRLQHAGGPRKGPAVDMLYMFDGSAAKLLKQGGLQAARACYIGTGGPALWNWGRVLTLIVPGP